MIEGGFVDGGDPDLGIVFAHGDVNVVAGDEETAGEDDAFGEGGAGVEVFADDRVEGHSGDFEGGMGFEGVSAHEVVPHFATVGED